MKKQPQLKEINEIVEKIWDEVLDQLMALKRQGGLVPIQDPQQYRVQLRKEITKETKQLTDEFSHRCRQGMKVLWKSFVHHNFVGAQQALEEMKKVCTLVERLGEDQKPFIEYLDKSTCLREFLGFSPGTMDNLYQAAFLLHESKQLQDAADAFYLLCTIDPFVHSFWMGYGHSEQLLGHLHAALPAYAMAALTDDSDPLPHCFAGECYSELADFKEARHSFDLAIERAERSPQHASIKKIALEKKQKILQ